MRDYENNETYIRMDKELDKLTDYRSQGKNVHKEIKDLKLKINEVIGEEVYNPKKVQKEYDSGTGKNFK